LPEATTTASYYDARVDDLLTALEEATRATPEGGPAAFVPPSGGELNQVESRFHHLIWGRRGSGKTSLLRHLEARRKQQKKVAVWIDEELFMALSYPDVLVSSVLEVVRGVRTTAHALGEEAEKSWWRRLLDQLGRKSTPDVLQALDRAATNLETLRQLPNNREIQWTRSTATGRVVDAIGSVKAGPIKGQAGESAAEQESVSSIETIVTTKEEYLERSLDETRRLLTECLKGIDGGFVFLDEFYRVQRPDQPKVLGYMHRLLKDTGLWLKVASVRYRTTPYRGGDPPVGMQPTQDANEVSLDRGLQLFDATKQFLEQIFENIATSKSVDIHSLMTPGALTRLVVAAGGVPRDYLRLAREAIRHARNRGPSEKQGSDKVIAEDVNSAAGQTAEPKIADLRADAPSEAAELENLLEDLGEFCRHNKVAYFLVDQRDPHLTKQIDQLQDLRLVHLLLDGETVPNAGSRRHRVLLLDVAYLSFKRARQVDFEGWNDRSKRRALRLIYTQGAGTSTLDGGKASESGLTDKNGEKSQSENPAIPLFEVDDADGPKSAPS
jgi:hypothetical protein